MPILRHPPPSSSLAQRKKPEKNFDEFAKERKKPLQASAVSTADSDLFAAGAAFDFTRSYTRTASGLRLFNTQSDDDDEVDEVEKQNWNEFLGSI